MKVILWMYLVVYPFETDGQLGIGAYHDYFNQEVDCRLQILQDTYKGDKAYRVCHEVVVEYQDPYLGE